MDITKDDIHIYFQDEDLIIVEKPSGILVHPSTECSDKTTLMSLIRNKIGQKVYPVHRLDRPVSGPVIFGLSGKIVTKLQEIWHSEKFIKRYICLTRRIIEEGGQFNFALSDDNGIKKEACTIYNPIKSYKNNTLVDVQILSGRRHQIRRHFSRRCFNIIGDTKYGKGKDNIYFRENCNLHRIFLHSTEIKFNHPITNDELCINSPIPIELQNVLDFLETNEKS
jgi:tRNA pseudouridine65 synthase